MKKCLILTTLGLLLAASLAAQKTTEEPEILSEHRDIELTYLSWFIVDCAMDPDLPHGDFGSPEVYKSRMTNKLRRNDISTYASPSLAREETDLDGAQLQLLIDVIRRRYEENGSFMGEVVYTIRVNVFERSWSSRDTCNEQPLGYWIPPIEVGPIASCVWSTTMFGVCRVESVRDKINGALDDSLEEFIADYHAQNDTSTKSWLKRKNEAWEEYLNDLFSE